MKYNLNQAIRYIMTWPAKMVVKESLSFIVFDARPVIGKSGTNTVSGHPYILYTALLTSNEVDYIFRCTSSLLKHIMRVKSEVPSCN